MNMCANCVHRTTCGLVSFYEAKGEHITKCPRRKPVTNADRIRAMSDEELARFIARQAGRYCDYKDPEEEEYERILPWLKSPVEEVDNGT